MRISIIAAVDQNRGIGKDNKMPWHIAEDLVKLKKLTLGHTVVLGRNSYESMVWYYDKSGRPMPGKMYIVVTRNQDYKPQRENAMAVQSVEQAIDKAKNIEQEEVFIIGGAQIFNEALGKNLVNRLYITVVEGDYDVDTYFPDYSLFSKIIFEEKQVSKTGQRFKFLTLER
jgi:dihydrofolate reductase